jgi:hypothetical protein
LIGFGYLRTAVQRPIAAVRLLAEFDFDDRLARPVATVIRKRAGMLVSANSGETV